MLLICKLLQHCDQLCIGRNSNHLARLSLWTTALFSSVCQFLQVQLSRLIIRNARTWTGWPIFVSLLYSLLRSSVDTGISVVPIYNFYADGESKNSSTFSATLTYTQNDSYYIERQCWTLIEGDSIRLWWKWASLVLGITLVDLVDANRKSTRSMVILFQSLRQHLSWDGFEPLTARYLADHRVTKTFTQTHRV